MLDKLARLDEWLVLRHIWTPEQPWPLRWERTGSPGLVGRSAHRHPQATKAAWVLLVALAGFLAKPIGALAVGSTPDFGAAALVGIVFALVAVVPVHRRVVALREAHGRFLGTDESELPQA